MSLLQLLIELKEKLPAIERKKESISGAPVGWHIQHSLMVINSIIHALQKSDEKKYQWKFNFLRTFIFATGKIPRGRVQSPKSVRPKQEYSADQLSAYFITTEANLKMLDSFPKNSFFTHPFFGDLNKKPAKTFITLHTRHHLKIINDIIK